MMSLIGTAIFGLIVGVLAKLLMPGKDPGGILITMLLGVAGAVLGGWVGGVLGLYGPGDSAGYIMATIGAIALLYLYRRFKSR